MSRQEPTPAQFATLLAPERVEAINLGVAAANFPEYARLVRDGVSLLRPAAVFLVLSRLLATIAARYWRTGSAD